MEKEILKYIGEAITHGLSEQEIKQNLLNVGWEPTVIEESFAHYRANEQKPSSNWDEDITVKPTLSNKEDEQINRSQITNTEILYSKKITETPVSKTKPKIKYLVLTALVFVGIMLLTGSSYAFYNNFYLKNQANKIWNGLVSKNLTAKVFSSKLELNYSDKETYESKEIKLKDLSANINSDLYLDNSNSENPKADLDLKINLNNNSTVTGFPINLKFAQKNLFLQISNNIILDNLVSKFTSGKKIGWLKISFENLQKNESTKGSLSYDTELKDKLFKSWKNAKIIKLKRFVKKEVLNNETVYHFENEIDKTALKEFMFEFIDLANKDAQIEKQSEINSYKNQVSILLEKLTVNNFETWLDKESNLYKIEFSSNAPSLSSLYKNMIEPEYVLSRDKKRIADIQQIKYSLEQFFKDYGGYPESENGQAKRLEKDYIGSIPEAPSHADGSCNDYYNKYWYSTSGQKKIVKGIPVYEGFNLTFCLGSETENYKPGIAKLTKDGIFDAQECDTSPENCPKPLKDSGIVNTKNNPNTLRNVDFNSVFSFKLSFYGLNQTKNIVVPEESTDIEELFQAFFGSITSGLQNITTENNK